ncbi:type III secretion protein [Burkholderia glumae]|uniref:type III secretion protein n=2 Tax=Burkholderia glumae TaxID=337 RepID=UPI000F5E805F|nr:type III secretion protein [Burkholderia glumae]MCM2494346.1 type III secretion protein [Burkholderia glumae]MCM2545294.1 type III secretion protein [Burkholderia glumae]MCQ0033669.1 type III secretion protein [Burkholderia glumae]MCQ0039974.1 type III secretion protein [Burkholderia glumae]QJW81110.1 type III secretion protein [Burkholderia glumae]
MKLLRILTGTHAGAQLQLAPGAHRIGTDDAADIRLTDWRGADLWLTVSDAGVVSAQAVASPTGAVDPGAASGPLEQILLVDFVPMQFEGTILCVGDEHGVWPSDYELLSTLLAAKPAAKGSPLRRRYLGIAAACFCVGAVIVTVSVLSTAQMSRAALPPNAGDHARRVTEALAAAHIDGLNAHAVGDTVVVTGMLGSSADDTAVRQLLNRLAITQVARQYDVAPEVARSIEDSLGVPGARVQYGGAGRFVIKGSVGNKNALDAAIARIRADLDPNVKDVVADVSESSGGANASDGLAYSEMLSADGVQYAQTPDGVKHIYASDLPEASGAAAAGTAQGPRAAHGSGADHGVGAPASVAANGAPHGADTGDGAGGDGGADPAATADAGQTAGSGDGAHAGAKRAAPQPKTADEFVPLPHAFAAPPNPPVLASANVPDAPPARGAEPSSRPPASPIAS